MRLVTWNEKNKPDLAPDEVIFDCNKMAENFKSRDTIIGGQEFGEDADMISLTNAFSGWTLVGKGPIPMLLNPKYFKVLDSGYVKTHSGMPNISPERGFNWVLVKRLNRPTVKPFIVIDTHYVSGAFDASKSMHDWRLLSWRTHHAILIKFVAKQNAAGKDVFLMGDMNKRNYLASDFGPLAYILSAHGLDHILACPAKKKQFKKLNAFAFMDFLFTDHKPTVAEFSLVRY